MLKDVYSINLSLLVPRKIDLFMRPDKTSNFCKKFYIAVARTPCKKGTGSLHRPMVNRWLSRLLPLLLIAAAARLAEAGDTMTREYWLKSTDAATMIQAINIVIRNPSGKRIMGGQGKHLVVTDLPEQQALISEILPIMDKPTTQTKPQRIVMEMVGWAGVYMHQNQIASVSARKTDGLPARAAPILSGVNSYDTFKSSAASVYAEEDARMMRQAKRIMDEALLPSLNDLALKGIIETNTGTPLALMSSGSALFTAREGGLYDEHRNRVKSVTAKVLKDRVILTGADRIPREITFKSSI